MTNTEKYVRLIDQVFTLQEKYFAAKHRGDPDAPAILSQSKALEKQAKAKTKDYIRYFDGISQAPEPPKPQQQELQLFIDPENQ